MDSAPRAGSSEPVFLVEGDRVALGPVRRDQIDLWQRWMNDPDTTRTLGGVNVYTREAEERFYDGATANDNQVLFAIYERASARHIGTTGLREVNYRQGTATFGIMIGEPALWNRGFGTEATRLVLDYAFHALGLHNVQLGVFDFNPRGVRAYEKAGFRIVGRRRQAYKLGQRRYDEIIMDALATDFDSPVLERRLHAPQERPGE
ncbi:MAG: GNAT family N-acetyltransferase [Dehalococcoidia bacterium]